jgi:hypothetical protein
MEFDRRRCYRNVQVWARKKALPYREHGGTESTESA